MTVGRTREVLDVAVPLTCAARGVSHLNSDVAELDEDKVSELADAGGARCRVRVFSAAHHRRALSAPDDKAPEQLAACLQSALAETERT